jgi:hypothetical protein
MTAALTLSRESFPRLQGVSTSQGTIFRILFIVTFFVCYVFPHSFQEVTAALIILTALSAIPYLNKIKIPSYIWLCYFSSITITILYLFIGFNNGAPFEAMTQISIIYIIAPFLWIIIGTSAYYLIGGSGMIKIITVYTIAAVFFVFSFFYFFINFGAETVQLFVDDPNVVLRGENAGATLMVYASFIFASGAYFAAPEVIRSKAVRLVILLLIAAVALSSGRVALMVLIAVAPVVGIILHAMAGQRGNNGRKQKGNILGYFVILIIATAAFLYLNSSLQLIDLNDALFSASTKLTDLGGTERQYQAQALLAAASAGDFLGSGHGIGVYYIRSNAYPWRYELVFMASLLRVGLIGTLIYSLPFVIYITKFFLKMRNSQLNMQDIFFFSGFLMFAIGSFTNPYAESYIFQWMLIFPMIFLEAKRKDLIA